jgi:hypothetical protein
MRMAQRLSLPSTNRLLLALALAGPRAAQTAWQKSDPNPVLSKWGLNEFFAVGQPNCWFERDTLKSWYAAGGVGTPSLVGRIYHAWSVDGVNWTRRILGIPVLDMRSARRRGQ